MPADLYMTPTYRFDRDRAIGHLDTRRSNGHDGAMPNYGAKGREYMRVLGRRGGLASGETRRLKRVGRITAEWTHRKWGISLPVIPDDGYSAAAHELWRINGGRLTLAECEELLRPEDRRGGSHNNDWRCPACYHFNSIKRRGCARCNKPGPFNGRLTRTALEAKKKQHQKQGYLRKFDL
jgi:hypothetical protein